MPAATSTENVADTGQQLGDQYSYPEDTLLQGSVVPESAIQLSRTGPRSLGETGAVLGRDDRLRVFGVDCTGPFGDGILFKGGEWSPGGEYVQRLRVKNVSSKLKKLKYRPPSSRFFSMEFPELIILSPGTVKEIDVVFRPESSEVYDDVILFKVLDGPNAGGFNVSVRALLPTLQVSIPTGLDFGYCQADDVSSRVFHVKNTGEVPAPFVCEVPPPFVMSPSEGVVPVGESSAVTCSLRPTDASVFVSQAIVRVGQGVNAIKPKPLLELKVSAIGKYCHVVPSQDEVDFGDQTVVAVASATANGEILGCARKEIVLRNESVVPAAFTIRRLEGDRDPAFTIQPSEGIISGEEEMIITAAFVPTSAGTFSRDHYEVVSTGGNTVTLGLQGRAVGCTVRLEKREDPFAKGCGVLDSINFREIKVGTTTSRVVYLYNETPEPCKFCFAIKGDTSAFGFSRTRGEIPPAGTEHPGEAHITLTFCPSLPTNYYRRVFCLLENQLPLAMDLIGTGYLVAKGEVEEQRPAPLRHAHVQALRNRVGPQGTPPLQGCGLSKPLTRSGEATRVRTAAAAEFFVDPSGPISRGNRWLYLPCMSVSRTCRRGCSSADGELNDVHLDRSCLDFGFVSGKRWESVTVHNSTNTEVYVAWNLENGQGDSRAAALSVSPADAHVPSGGSATFHVELFPSKRNCYFSEEVEAFVSPSNQRTFRTVDDATQQPPWCLPLNVLGHSFAGEHFLARASLSTHHTGQRLCFPACHLGDTVYQAIRVSNQGNTPASFRFGSDPSGAFEVKPVAGVIPASDFQLCVARFTPPGLGSRCHRMACIFNYDPRSCLEVELFGQGASPAVRAEWASSGRGGASVLSLDASSGWSSEAEEDEERNGVFYLRPSCVGLMTSRTFQLRNPSRVPGIFTIDPPRGSSEVLRVSPLAGLLLGNQSATVDVAFAPREPKEYRFRLPVKVRSILGETATLTDCRQLAEAAPTLARLGTCIDVVGRGERGAVMFHPDSLTFSVRLVNTPESKQLILENCSECDVSYRLFYIANREPRVASTLSVGSEGDACGAQAQAQQDLRAVPRENGESKGQGGPNKVDSLFIDRPDGTLPARSRARTIVTFRPVSQGEYLFSLLCQVAATTDPTGDSPVSAMRAAMAEEGNKARAAAARLQGGRSAATAASHDKAWDVTGVHELGKAPGDASMMPLRCTVHGRASFPTVVFRDVRMTKGRGEDVLGASPRRLWSALSLSRINHMLQRPLSKTDVRFNQESSPDTSQLPRFEVPFVPTAIGTGPLVISLQVSNPGFLHTSMTVDLPNTKPVEMETWASEGEPTAEELRQNDVIDRLRAFALSPPPGTVIELAAGEQQPLRIAYSADSLSYGGVHDLPVLVRIREGRSFWLDLKGTTLRPQSSLLHVPTGLSREYTLEPVAVGTPFNEAPLQTTELLNVGEAELSYLVDTAKISDANARQGHGVPVFRLEEACGTIAGGGRALLRWRFLPLESKEYVLRTLIRASRRSDSAGEEEEEDDQFMEITLRGTGYDPRTRDPYR